MIIEKLSAGLSSARFSCWNLIKMLRWGHFFWSIILSCVFVLLMQVTYPTSFMKLRCSYLARQWPIHVTATKNIWKMA